MNEALEQVIEGYATALTQGHLYFALILSKSDPETGTTTSRRIVSRNLDFIVAAGMCRHWAVALLRLKFGLDASEYRNVQARFVSLAEQTGTRLNWNTPELTRFLAVEALQGWLLDRRFRGTDAEWKRRCVVLRNLLNSESRKAANAIQAALGV